MNDFGYSDAERRCVELSSISRGVWLGGRRARELNASAVSSAEWSYLFGLFLADGCSDANLRTEMYRVRFLLQGDEWEIAWRVAEMLRRAGLNPYVSKERRKDMLVVRVYSKALREFLPDKKALRNDALVRERFLRENDLYGLVNGVPFCAGFVDGDGICRAYRRESRARKRKPCPGMFEVRWHFTQKSLPFLNGFFEGFVGSLAKYSTFRLKRCGKVEGISVNLPGREALLRAGFASWSVKAAECVEEVSELRAEQARLRKAAGWRERDQADIF